MVSPEAAAPKVFLVEDDEVVVGVVEEAVASAGCAFSSVRLVSGALEAIKAFVPDIVLLDLTLPDGQGFTICEGMRDDASLKDIPVVILTSKGELESRLKGFAVGAQDYVVKPFSVAELMARVSAHLSLKSQMDTLEEELIERRLHDRVRQDVMDMVVHDLRTPLSTIRVTLDLIKKTGLLKDEPYSRYLAYAEHSVEFTLFMVTDLLDLGAGKTQVNPGRFKVLQLVDRLDKMVGIQFRTKKVSFKIDVPEGLAFTTDQSVLFRVLLNIVSNSLKFSPQGTVVTLTARLTGALLRIEVRDCGPGIPDVEKEVIFQKFYRAQSAKADAVPGAGIGLAFCRLASQAMGGKVWVEDAPERGSRFIFEIPELEAGQ